MSSDRVPTTPNKHAITSSATTNPDAPNTIATDPLSSIPNPGTIPTQADSDPRVTQLRIDEHDSLNKNMPESPVWRPQSPPPFPTENATSPQKRDDVQVPQSSPRVPTTTTTAQPNSYIPGLAHSIAPPGTSFQPPRYSPPAPAQPPRPMVLSDDDDGPTYRGSSDNDDRNFLNKTSIKPSSFAQTGGTQSTAQPSARRFIPPGERVPESPIGLVNPGINRFKEITAGSLYNPANMKRPAENSLYSASTKQARTDAGPNRAGGPSSGAAPPPMRIEDIKDFQQRISVNRMLQIFPAAGVAKCFEVLKSQKGNYVNALKAMAKILDLDADGNGKGAGGDDGDADAEGIEDDEDGVVANQRARKPPAPAAKQQIKRHANIQDRWAANRAGPTTTTTTTVPSPKPAAQKQVEHSPPPLPAAAAKPPLRRLVRGTRPSTPATLSSASSRASSPPAAVSRGVTPISSARGGGRLKRGRRPVVAASSDAEEEEAVPSDSDSDAAPRGAAVQYVDPSERPVLEFFNKCSAEDLADLAEVSEEIAGFVISKRPFGGLDAVRVIAEEPVGGTGQNATASGGRKGRAKTRKAIGEKIVDKCLQMWTGYEAVDELVQRCAAYGEPIAREMEKWGVDIYGDPTKGPKELEIVSLGNENGNGAGKEDAGKDSEQGKTFIKQPEMMKAITMKNYQIVGLNWLSLLFDHGLSCILADDMGLGKTAQVISFLAHLHERGVTGPHLVVVPASTLENWLREFQTFCPGLSVMPYYAGQEARNHIRADIAEKRDSINVVVTTYTIAKAKIDSSFLRSMNFCVCVFDEGHMLKNSKSTLYGQLVRIPAEFRLLLTGTPLQNNLQELVSLLGFILPTVFRERRDDLEYIFSAKAKTVDDTHANLLSAQRITRAKSMLAPFVLRRKKHQVIDLPPKINRVEYCEMNQTQREIYDHEVEEVRKLLLERAQGIKPSSKKSANNLMRLRQVALHPLFFRRIYNDATIRKMSKAAVRDEQWALSDPDQIFIELQAYNDFECHSLCINNPVALARFQLKNDEWMNSGKVTALCELLRRFKANGDRTLIFSQFTMVMDILEHVLETLAMGFYRLDGSTSVEDRQTIVDAFHENEDVPVFLLSTKAGGAGINLACANKVIIFDSGFNPQDDVQAENRVHRVGQVRPVEVVRLVTRGTIEEQIYALGRTKLALDQRVAGESEEGGAAGKKSEEAGLQVVESMLAENLKHEEEVGEGGEEGKS